MTKQIMSQIELNEGLLQQSQIKLNGHKLFLA